MESEYFLAEEGKGEEIGESWDGVELSCKLEIVDLTNHTLQGHVQRCLLISIRATTFRLPPSYGPTGKCLVDTSRYTQATG
jgi:hypothetical protein